MQPLLNKFAKPQQTAILIPEEIGNYAKLMTIMVANTVPKITALEAEAAASLFLSDHLPDRITASDPHLDVNAGIWHVPVLLAYPIIGSVGEVGEIIVSGQTEEILSHTPVDEMLARARALYNQHCDQIEAPVP
jgi:hypothetical protein